jgi:hypothetical protein
MNPVRVARLGPLLWLLAVVALVACGGTPQSGKSTSDQSRSSAAYEDCLRQHGAPAPTTNANGTTINGSSSQFEQAQAACSSLAPPGATPPPASVAQQQALKWAECMRQHGVNVPDPGTSDNNGPVNIDTTKPQFKDAQQACRNLRPSGGPGTTTVAGGS